MSQQYRLARGRKGWTQQRSNADNHNKQKFNDLRKNHELKSLKLKIIGNKSRPAEILTARKAKQESTTNRAAKIQANLQHMQEAARKKKQAQERYYGQGRSPMRKQNFKPQNQTPKNPQINSLQQRLGNNKTVTFNNTNMNKNIPKKQFVPQIKQNKMNRVQNYNNKIQNRKNFNNQQNFNHQNKTTIRTRNPRTGEVKILRPLKQKGNNNNAKQPQNFTVSVGNKRNNMKQNQTQKHHVVSELNPTIQQEIRMIQNKSTMATLQGMVAQVPNMLQETQVPIMTTRTTLHERFSRI